ncbi:MAG: amidase [Gammaproteobacteria bacterium]|nr:amidase [Gammaproteobacteria bacterium]
MPAAQQPAPSAPPPEPELPLHFRSAPALAHAIRTGETDSRALTRLFLDRIEHGSGLRAFTHVAQERAEALAEAADRLLGAGIVLGPLHGVPVAVKDSLAWEGTPLSGGSLARADCISDHTSAVVRRLIASGMVVLGKTAMTEFAFGLSGQNPTCGTARNPWDALNDRAPGGSSSGSGVAVAAGLAPIAIGGDTGGSVRAPALMNHLVGYKPSSGLISRAGCLPLSPTLDVLGPIARTVEDARILTAVLTGPDSGDPVTLTAQPTSMPPGTCRVAVLAEEAWPMPMDPEAMDHWRRALGRVAGAGWTLETWSPPAILDFDRLGRDNSTVLAHEAYQRYGALARDETAPLWSVIRARIRAGAGVGDADYAAALERRKAVGARFAREMASVAGLLMPGSDQSARTLDPEDERHAGLGAFLRPANFLGAAAITLPTSRDSDGMPLGLQLLTPHGTDSSLLAVAAGLERAIGAGRPVPDLGPWGLT